jgi:CIC family chloride channel protein
VAGTIFAFEVVIKRYSLQRLAPVVIAAVAGTAVNRLYYGDFPAWHNPEHVFVSYWEFPAFAVLGVVCAAAAFLLIRCVGLVSHLMGSSPIPRVMRPAVAGLGVGAIAVFFPEVLGIGYEAVDAALRESLPLAILVAVAAAKIVATGLSLGSGFGGGIFSPSLVVGAMIGGAFGIVATAAIPELSSGPGAYTIVGMGAVAGAVLGAPLQAILIIFEMTTSYSLALAVMLATVISAILVNDVLRIDFFSWQLSQRGIDLKAAIPQTMLGDVPIRLLVCPDAPRVSTNAGHQAIVDAFAAAPVPELLVVDTDGRLVGRLSYRDFAAKASADSSTLEALTADAIATPHGQVLEASDDAATAWLLFAQHNTDRLPVVEDRASARLIGYLDRQDLVIAYQRALTKTL